MNKEVLDPSSMLFIPEKNQPYFLVDEIELPVKITKRSETINPIFIKSITHTFSCHDCSTYMHTTIFYKNGSKKKINIFTDYQTNNFVNCLQSTLNIICENVYLMPYKSLYIPIFFKCGKDIPQKKTRRQKATNTNKIINKSMALIDHLRFDDIIVGDLTQDANTITSDNTNHLLDILNKNTNIPFANYNIRYTQEIKFPTFYVNGVDKISSESGNYHANTIYLYLSQTVFYSNVRKELEKKYGWNTEGEKQTKSKTHNNIINILFNTAISLFYINISTGTVKENDLNTLNIFYLELAILRTWYFFQKHKELSTMDYMTLWRKTQKKLERINTIGIYKHIYSIRGIVGCSYSANQCRFPDDWTKEEKNEWKQDNGIERKKRKKETEKRTTSKVNDKIIKKVIKLHTQGYSLREIEKKLKKEITTTTISKIIKNSITQE